MHINLIQCKNEDEYIERIKELEIKYPVLDDKVIDHLIDALQKEGIEYSISRTEFVSEKVKSLTEAINDHNLSVNNVQNIIFSFENDGIYSWIALHHAKLVRSKLCLVKDYQAIYKWIQINSPQYVTLVCRNSVVTFHSLIRIREMQNEFSSQKDGCYLGILTARDPYTLISLIVRNDIYKKRHLSKYVHVMRVDHLIKEITHENDIYAFPFDKALVNEVRSLFQAGPVNLTTMIGHGRDELFWLTDGVICGESRYCSHPNSEKKWKPSCYYTDNCFKAGVEVIHAYDICSRHMFINSCMSENIEDAVFGNQYNLFLAFLDGHAVSYLGSYTLINGMDLLNMYYMAQLLSGISLGIAALNVNMLYSNCKLGHPFTTYLIGDPTFCLNEESKPYLVKVESLNFDNHTFKYSFALESSTYLIMIELPDANLVQLFYNFEYKIIVHSQPNQLLYGSIRIVGTKAVIDIFSNGLINAGEIFLIIQCNIRCELSAISKLNIILDTGLNPGSKYKSYLIESENSIRQLAKVMREKISVISKASDDIYKKFDKINERLSVLSEMTIKYLINKVHEKGFLWTDHCIGNGFAFKEYLHKVEYCPNCGKQLYIVHYQHNIHKDLQREYHMCIQCGSVRDMPCSKNTVQLRFVGNYEISAGSELTGIVEIENGSDAVQEGHIGIAVMDGKSSNITYEDQFDKVFISPKEKKQIAAKITFDRSVRPHNYWIMGIAILNGDIFTTRRDVFVNDGILKI